MSRSAASSVVAAASVAVLTAVCEPALADSSTGASVEVPIAPHQIPALGPADAPIRIEVYFVIYSRGVAELLDAAVSLQRAHPRRVQLQLRPLARNGSYLFAEALYEAHQQGKLDEFLGALPIVVNTPSRDELLAAADRAGVDRSALQATWLGGELRPSIDDNDSRRHVLRSVLSQDVLFNGSTMFRDGQSTATRVALETEYARTWAEAQAWIVRGVDPSRIADVMTRARLADQPPPFVALAPADGESGSFEPNEREMLLGLPLPASRAQTAPRTPAALSPSALADPAIREPALRPDSVIVTLACDVNSIACANQVERLSKAKQAYGDRISLAYVPIVQLNASDATGSAIAGDALYCTDDAARAWRWLETLTVSPPRTEALWGSPLEGMGKQDGFFQCLAVNSGRSVRATITAHRHGLTATPTVVIDGIGYPGGFAHLRSLLDVVDQARAPGVLFRWNPD